MYFRKSKFAQKFFETAEKITKNWTEVRNTMLINCHDKYPSTDVVFALAYRIMDPTMQGLVDYEWFKFIHHKPDIHGVKVRNHNDYLLPNRSGEKIYLGETRLSKVWHYHDKELDVSNI